MRMDALPIEGAWVVAPDLHTDDRGLFLEWFTSPGFASAVGHGFDLVQANCSVSARGVVRGIHYASMPPGQAKYVTCVSGAVLDVIVDTRVGSPTFGRWASVRLDDQSRRAVYLSEGLGHGFCSLADGSTVVYLCTSEYDPSREHAVNPLDPALAIDWGVSTADMRLSAKDRTASSLSQMATRGMLPTWAESA